MTYLVENLSIRTKLVLMFCVTALLSLAILVTALVFYEKQSVKKNLTMELASMADVVGLNNGAALLFNDNQAAVENLSSLSAKCSVTAAILYDKSGEISASYTRIDGNDQNISPPLENRAIDGKEIPDLIEKNDGMLSFQSDGNLHVIRRVYAKNMLMGYIQLVDDMQTLRDRLTSYYLLLSIVVAVTLLLVILMASKLQVIFTAPLFKLMHSMERVMSGNHYDVTITASGQDEFGTLISHFNKMIREIQFRDQALQDYSADLEQRVELRTQDLSFAKLELEQTVEDLEIAKTSAEAASLAKSRFLANMSHEIRTPMNAILGFLSLSLEDNTLPESHREHLTIAHKSANSLLVLLNEILDLSKIESGKQTFEEKPFSLKRMLVNLIEPLSHHAKEKSLSLTHELSTNDLDMVMGDPSHVNQILANLIHNAIKFTEKGNIHIKVTVAPPDLNALPTEESSSSVETSSDPSDTTLNMKRNDASDASQTESEVLLFSVSDTGIGIPEDRIATLFDAFTQADASTTRRYGGTGLGTAVAKQLVGLMGGTIWVESVVGEGSTFHFTIPFKIAPNTALSHSIPDFQMDSEKNVEKKPQHEPHRILVVDDIIENIIFTTRYLEKRGNTAIGLQSAAEALELLEKERVDLVLMDIHMPEMDGLEATRKIRDMEIGRGTHVPIIAVTASVMSDEIAQYFEAGMDGVVQKPVDFKQLDQAIETLLAPLCSTESYSHPNTSGNFDIKNDTIGADNDHDGEDKSLRTSTPHAASDAPMMSHLNGENRTHVKEQLERLKEACGQYSPDAVEPFIHDLEKTLGRTPLHPIRNRIEQFDFDGVISDAVALAETLGLS